MFAAHAHGAIGSLAKTYIEDVFSTHSYTGTGSAQTIANGVGLADSPVTQAFSAFAYRGNNADQKINVGWNVANGALIWTKDRTAAVAHQLVDTVRGSSSILQTNTTGAVIASQQVKDFTSDGYTATTTGGSGTNLSGRDYIAWAFAKKAKFMDIVTWTGDGTAGSTRAIAHALGIAPGFIIAKRIDSTSDWAVWHRNPTSNGTTGLSLNGTGAAGNNAINTHTASVFHPGFVIDAAGNNSNANGAQYVAYIFAHDTASDGMIQCGSFTTNGSGVASVTLGWRPQWLLVKSSTTAQDWFLIDTTRGMTDAGNNQTLLANSSGAEYNESAKIGGTSTGFASVNAGLSGNQTFIYMAIRAPETSSTGGGMVWTKPRNQAYGHVLIDTVRGNRNVIRTDLTNASGNYDNEINQFGGNGYTVGSSASYGVTNPINTNLVSWTFKRAPKFFDVVQYTGSGSPQTVAHSLGQVPGMIVVKRTNGTGDWYVWHCYFGTSGYLKLNTTDTGMNTGAEFIFGNNSTPVNPTATHFTVGATLDSGGATYIAYLFAHDTSTDGLIQCGSFTTDGSGNATVTLGWEPQFGIFKNSAGAATWIIQDVVRGAPVDGGGAYLAPNLSNAEAAYSSGVGYMAPTATGFSVKGLGVSSTFIYLAIRRGPMRKPTSGTQVYNAIARTGTGATATVNAGFPIDLLISGLRAGPGHAFYDRMRGRDKYLLPYNTNAEGTVSDAITEFTMSGITAGADSGNINVNYSGQSLIHHFFRRYPGVFDIVAYTGTGAARTVPHNLTVAPELIITKMRSSTGDWYVYHKTTGKDKINYLNYTYPPDTSVGFWGSADPTSTGFNLGGSFAGNSVSQNYIAYLFATLAGISKVGSYVGNGTSQTIDCGFAAGSRFVLIKRTDNTGDWLVYDSVRGIVAANDPVLSLQSTAAEFTGADYIDPNPVGFDVVHSAVNTNGASYVYLALS